MHRLNNMDFHSPSLTRLWLLLRAQFTSRRQNTKSPVWHQFPGLSAGFVVKTGYIGPLLSQTMFCSYQNICFLLIRICSMHNDSAKTAIHRCAECLIHHHGFLHSIAFDLSTQSQLKKCGSALMLMELTSIAMFPTIFKPLFARKEWHCKDSVRVPARQQYLIELQHFGIPEDYIWVESSSNVMPFLPYTGLMHPGIKRWK